MESEPPKRIPLTSGEEQDVFTRARRIYTYTSRSGVCQAIKRQYSRRLRRLTRQILRQTDTE